MKTREQLINETLLAIMTHQGGTKIEDRLRDLFSNYFIIEKPFIKKKNIFPVLTPSK